MLQTRTHSTSQKVAALTLSHRQLCDLELILNGGFAPLTGFMNQADYESVVELKRLKNGNVWPMPITLDINEDFANTVEIGDKIVLQDKEGISLAAMTVEEKWFPDKQYEALNVFGTLDKAHPGVNYLFTTAGKVYLGGKLEQLSLPTYYDFLHLRLSPTETKALFNKLGWKRIVAFQTRNPMHRAHQELTFRAARENNANLLIHPVVGLTKPGDIDHFTRVRCYEKVLTEYPPQTTALALLPLAMRMAGPREALWHALIRKNYGCTHFIVGRDHAGPGNNSQGQPFYGAYDAQDLVKQYQHEIGIEMIPFQEMVYVSNKSCYQPIDKTTQDDTILKISGTEFRRMLMQGEDIPTWFTYPGIVDELRKTHPPKHKQGFTVFFTGLSGAGKSTLANALAIKLLEKGDRTVTLLDGDIVRKHLSSELGFSKNDRILNITRIGYVASEITRHRGIALCALIAPYEEARKEARSLIEAHGGFIEVHVATPLTVCEQRDRKDLYKKARAGIIKEFTGINDPYESPTQAEIVIDTSTLNVEAAVNQILSKLNELGFLLNLNTSAN